MRGLLDGITAIPAIMAEQGCSREEAECLWILSMQVTVTLKQQRNFNGIRQRQVW